MQEMMQAAVLTGPREITVKSVPVPRLRDGDIKIKVSACGVCGSDIHMWKTGHGWSDNQGDFVMGHEFCGVVVDPGQSHFSVGERVVFWANLYCGKCDMCRSGQEQLCRQVNGTNYIGFVTNGAYCQYYVGPAVNAYPLPDAVSDVAAALIDPLMVAYHAVIKSGLKMHDKVLVVGSGIIGQLIGGLAKKAGASVLALSKVNDRKIAKAKEIGDFDCYLDGNDPERPKRMYELSRGGFDIAFEVVGAEDALSTCIDGAKPGGTIVAIGNSIAPKVGFELNRLVLHEIRLLGSVSCTEKEFRETIDLIANATIDPEKYVTDVLPLDQLQHAFERLTSKTDPVLKLVIKP